MKKKDIKSLREKTAKDIYELILKAKNELMDMRLNKTQNKLKNTSQISLKRKDIAQMLSLVKELELSGKSLEKGQK
jgi:ribosomal protein L29